MSATASRPARDRVTGRYAARPPRSVCAQCGWTLAEDLAGRLYCAHQRCEAYRVAVDVVPGVQPGTLTAEMLEPPT